MGQIGGAIKLVAPKQPPGFNFLGHNTVLVIVKRLSMDKDRINLFRIQYHVFMN